MSMLAQISPTLLPADGASGLYVTYLAILSLAVLCGILSLVVVWRRWAFLGEGIAHAGFGGAGTAWMLAALIPAADTNTVVFAAVTGFCLLTGIAIGIVHRRGNVHSDTAIGAFLVGALAWGFIGQQVYLGTYHRIPAGFQSLLFGQTQLLNHTHAQLTVALTVVCLTLLTAFGRQILLYCLDPALAQTSGVRTGFIHYLLILLVTVTIILGVPMLGSVLITAMLILPGAAAMLLSRRLTGTLLLSAAIGAGGALAGILINRQWPILPQGPCIVLSLFVFFIGSWLVSSRQR